MASAFEDKKGWIANFRGIGRRRNVRIPQDYWDNPNAYADECERYCKFAAVSRRPADIKRALELKAITPEQATELLGGIMPTESSNERLTVKEAASRQPSYAREDAKSARRHCRELDNFLKWANIAYQDELTLKQVMDYIAYMKQQGFSFDGRRHRLIPIRRACRMGATQGPPPPPP